MAVTFVGSSITTYANRAGSVSVAKPTGSAQGDVLILSLFCKYDFGTDPNTPTGFTLLQRTETMSAAGFSARVYSYAKVLTASEPSTYEITFSEGRNTQLLASIYRGASGLPTLNAVAQGTGTASSVSVNIPATGKFAVYVGSDWEGAGTLSPPSGFTERVDNLVYLATRDSPPTGTNAIAQTNGNTSSSYPWSAQALVLSPTATSSTITPTPYTNTSTINNPVVSATGAARVYPLSYVGVSVINSPTITATGAVSIYPSSYVNTSVVGNPTVTPSGTASVYPLDYTNVSVVGAPVVSTSGVVTIYPADYTNLSVINIPSVDMHRTINVYPFVYVNTSIIEVPVVSASSAVTIYPLSYVNTEVMGSVSLIRSPHESGNSLLNNIYDSNTNNTGVIFDTSSAVSDVEIYDKGVSN